MSKVLALSVALLGVTGMVAAALVEHSIAYGVAAIFALSVFALPPGRSTTSMAAFRFRASATIGVLVAVCCLGAASLGFSAGFVTPARWLLILSLCVILLEGLIPVWGEMARSSDPRQD
ncbi:hypothetical protein [Pseudomarimonas arenosa]|uniref:Uncharacterized protein n=1 Tax=Pseudomarimonas arenosa TaxID=2774145 RepID=A0AAW3ZVH6_9GAMM|nr:hypothetical protein [Pseudomarimonas arenosa]MBD8528292.1 hypothetical protein [Pseudomarimonas arenosa]